MPPPTPKIPGYELHACLGGGTLTSVYAARNLETDAPCAIKLLRPDWTEEPVAIKLLQREARASLAVRHANLVALRDAHVTRPPYYLVLEMLAGESLRRRLRRDYRIGATPSLCIVRQIADALAALHRKGFIHGDVKPDNIRLIEPCRAVLLDLGFAHRPGENARLREDGYILGTANYLAPELCGSEPKDDPRSDIFSLGVTLFEMLTGVLPYPPGSERETLRRRQADVPFDLCDHMANPPAGLPELVDSLLAAEPQERPHALGLVHDLVELEIKALGRRAA
ncbi:MAG: serine/threonine-protein kinase [Gemmataceae bacterium]